VAETFHIPLFSDTESSDKKFVPIIHHPLIADSPVSNNTAKISKLPQVHVFLEYLSRRHKAERI
jgi:hypothetical protein